MIDNVFKQMVTETTTTRVRFTNHIAEEDYDIWRKDFTWEALHGQRYGQSFCNRFGIHDNHLYYNTGGVEWADSYIKKNYVARS